MRLLGVVAVLASATSAVAEPRSGGENDVVGRPIVLAPGELHAQLAIELNLQRDLIGRPLSLAPDAWMGLTPRWTVGVIHSNQSVDRIDAGATLCVRQLAPKCERLVRGTGVEVRWSARASALAVAPRARLLLRDVDPAKPAGTIGALVRWAPGRFAITSDPYLRVGLGNRDLGNRDALVVPAWFAIQPTCRWAIGVHTGWDSDLAVWRDGWHVPLGLVVQARATDHFELGLEAGFPSLLGPQNNVKVRAMSITLGWRGGVF